MSYRYAIVSPSYHVRLIAAITGGELTAELGVLLLLGYFVYPVRSPAGQRTQLTGWRTTAPEHARRDDMVEGTDIARPVFSQSGAAGCWPADHYKHLPRPVS